MSRKNYIHSADSFLSANGITRPALTPVSEPVSEPVIPTSTTVVSRPATGIATTTKSDSLLTAYKSDPKPAPATTTEAVFTPREEPVSKPTPIEEVILEKSEPVSKPALPVYAPVLPVILTEPAPVPVGSGGFGGGFGGSSSRGNGGSKGVVNKSWIPLVLAVVGAFILIRKPLK